MLWYRTKVCQEIEYIYRAYSIFVDLFFRHWPFVNLFTYFIHFSNTFLNKLTLLCRVYIIIPRSKDYQGVLLASTIVTSYISVSKLPSGKNAWWLNSAPSLDDVMSHIVSSQEFFLIFRWLESTNKTFTECTSVNAVSKMV